MNKVMTETSGPRRKIKYVPKEDEAPRQTLKNETAELIKSPPQRSRSHTSSRAKSKLSLKGRNLGRSLSAPRSPNPGEAVLPRDERNKKVALGTLDKLLGFGDDDDDDAFFAGLNALKPKEKKQRSKFVDNPSVKNTVYKTLRYTFNGSIQASKLNEKDVRMKKITKAIDEFQQNPDKYLGLYYYGWMKSQPLDQQQYYLIFREGTENLKIDFDSSADRTIWLHTKGELGVSDDSYQQALEKEPPPPPPPKKKTTPKFSPKTSSPKTKIKSYKPKPKSEKEKKEYQAAAVEKGTKARNRRLELDERLRAQAEERAAANDKGSSKVKRIPKRSAMLAMGGPEVDEYNQMMREEKVAMWQAKAGDEWEIVCDQTFDGVSTAECTQEMKVKFDSVDAAIEKFMEDPEQYRAMFFPASHIQYPDANNRKVEVTMVIRAGTTNYRPLGVRNGNGGHLALFQHIYHRLKPMKDDLFPKKFRDNFTNDLHFKGKKLHNKKKQKRKPLLPGRGMGLGDRPTMTFIGDTAEPNDVIQGMSIGNCWLLSAIASLADFDFAIRRLFRKTPKPKLEERPTHLPNRYVVTLWDLKTWTEVDIVVDEQLPVKSDNSGHLLGARPSKEGKLWVTYLEKAIAHHCGGYEKLIGGNPNNAWNMLTGSRNQYCLMQNVLTKKFKCTARFDMAKKEWLEHSNSPHDCDQTTWEVPWPSVGGGGERGTYVDPDELFHKIVAWDSHNYLIGASTDGVSDKNSTDGLVDNHAYSIIDSRVNICDTGIDVLLIRNPWGEGGELKSAKFARNGPGWEEHPEIEDELKPSKEDNGMCWVTKEEFFDHFPTIYLSAFNTARLKDRDYVNDLVDEFPRNTAPMELDEEKKSEESSVASDDSSSVEISSCSSVVSEGKISSVDLATSDDESFSSPTPIQMVFEKDEATMDDTKHSNLDTSDEESFASPTPAKMVFKKEEETLDATKHSNLDTSDDESFASPTPTKMVFKKKETTMDDSKSSETDDQDPGDDLFLLSPTPIKKASKESGGSIDGTNHSKSDGRDAIQANKVKAMKDKLSMSNHQKVRSGVKPKRNKSAGGQIELMKKALEEDRRNAATKRGPPTRGLPSRKGQVSQVDLMKLKFQGK